MNIFEFQVSRFEDVKYLSENIFEFHSFIHSKIFRVF